MRAVQPGTGNPRSWRFTKAKGRVGTAAGGGNGETRPGDLLAQLVEAMRKLRTEIQAGQDFARAAHLAMVGQLEDLEARLRQAGL